MYYPDGGTSGEMSIEWFELGGKLVPQLKCFDDGWSSLSLFGDLVGRMAELDNKNIQEEGFCRLLDECGFKDLTRYKI